jgi:cysteine-rich repeat protein
VSRFVTALLLCGCSATSFEGRADVVAEGDAVGDAVDVEVDTGPACDSPSCGNGIVEGCEECDDGDHDPLDGCDECRIAAFGVRSSGSCHEAAVDMAEDGSFVVVCGGDGLLVRMWDATGRPDDLEVPVSGSGYSPDVAVSPDGRFVVVWTDFGSSGLHYRCFEADGTARTLAMLASVGPDGWFAEPAVAVRDDGSFLVAWMGPDGSERGISARAFDAECGVASDVVVVNTYRTDDQTSPDVASDGERYLVSWDSYTHDGVVFPIVGRWLDGAGVPLGDEITLSSFDRSLNMKPGLAMVGGLYTVAWSVFGLDGSSYTMVARRFDATGPLGDGFRVNTTPNYLQWSPAVAMGRSGRFVVVWANSGTPEDNVVRGQLYGPGGESTGSEFLVGAGAWPDVAMAPDGRFVAVWTVFCAGEAMDVLGQRFDASGRPLGSIPW